MSTIADLSHILNEPIPPIDDAERAAATRFVTRRGHDDLLAMLGLGAEG